MTVRAVGLHTPQVWRSVQETHATYTVVSLGKSIDRGGLTMRSVEKGIADLYSAVPGVPDLKTYLPYHGCCTIIPHSVQSHPISL